MEHYGTVLACPWYLSIGCVCVSVSVLLCVCVCPCVCVSLVSVCVCVCVCVVVEIEIRAWCMLGKHPATKLLPYPSVDFN